MLGLYFGVIPASVGLQQCEIKYSSAGSNSRKSTNWLSQGLLEGNRWSLLLGVGGSGGCKVTNA